MALTSPDGSLLLHWGRLGGAISLQYDGPRDVWIAQFEDGMELRVSGRDVRFVGQDVRAYCHHERFLHLLRPARG